MASQVTVKPELYHVPKKDGKKSILLRITYQQQTKRKRLKFSVLPEHWNKEKGEVRRSNNNYKSINLHINQETSKVKSIINTLVLKEATFNIDTIITHYDGQPTETTFFDFSKKIITALEQKGDIRTSQRYSQVVDKLKEYCKNKPLDFEAITVEFLNDYETHLIKKKKNKTNTVHTNFKTIRAILNRAIREGYMKREKYPFFDFKLKSESTTKERLTQSEIKALEELILEKGSRMYDAKNTFLFSYYCGGLRIGDQIQLKWKNIINDRLVYKMEKTNVSRNSKLATQAIEILNLYRDETNNPEHYIFPLFQNNIDYSDTKFLKKQISSKTSIVNNNLKKIATKLKWTKKLTSHIARHSFADLARKKDISIYDISKTLGHTNTKITENYLASFDVEAVDNTIDKMFAK